MRVLLIGSTGQLGSELRQALRHLDVVAPGRDELDLEAPARLSGLVTAVKPRLIVNAGAYTDVDGAETDQERAFCINRDAVAELGRIAVAGRVALIHYSTDFVFDGRKGAPYVEDDATNPLGVYGASKLAGEHELLALAAPAIVLRTAWVYGLKRKSFVNSILKLARERTELRVVNDQVGNPTFCGDLARATARLIETLGDDPHAAAAARAGVYHLAGSGYVSRYDLARQVLALDPRAHEHTARSVQPVPSNAFPTPATRPLFAPLDCSKIERAFAVRLAPWQEALAGALNAAS